MVCDNVRNRNKYLVILATLGVIAVLSVVAFVGSGFNNLATAISGVHHETITVSGSTHRYSDVVVKNLCSTNVDFVCGHATEDACYLSLNASLDPESKWEVKESIVLDKFGLTTSSYEPSVNFSISNPAVKDNAYIQNVRVDCFQNNETKIITLCKKDSKNSVVNEIKIKLITQDYKVVDAVFVE